MPIRGAWAPQDDQGGNRKRLLVVVFILGLITLAAVSASNRQYLWALTQAWQNPNGPERFFLAEGGGNYWHFQKRRWFGITVLQATPPPFSNMWAYDGPDSYHYPDPKGTIVFDGKRLSVGSGPWGADGRPLGP